MVTDHNHHTTVTKHRFPAGGGGAMPPSEGGLIEDNGEEGSLHPPTRRSRAGAWPPSLPVLEATSCAG